MSIIGKKPYINTIIDELLEDEAGGGVEVLTDLSYLVNEASEEEPTPLDFTNPLEEIYNYEELGNVCSLTHTTIKLSEGLVVTGFLVITSNHNALFTFDESGENMECYDLVWTEYERSYKTVNESLDANEFRREIALQGGSGGGGSKPLIIEVEGTMQTSTLPAIVVPKLTKEQLENAVAAIQGGQAVLVSSTNGMYFANEIDTATSGIRMVYQQAYLDYYLEGNNVICEYVNLGGGGGTKWYRHDMTFVGKTTLTGISLYAINDATDYSKTYYHYTNAANGKELLNILISTRWVLVKVGAKIVSNVEQLSAVTIGFIFVQNANTYPTRISVDATDERYITVNDIVTEL